MCVTFESGCFAIQVLAAAFGSHLSGSCTARLHGSSGSKALGLWTFVFHRRSTHTTKTSNTTPTRSLQLSERNESERV